MRVYIIGRGDRCSASEYPGEFLPCSFVKETRRRRRPPSRRRDYSNRTDRDVSSALSEVEFLAVASIRLICTR